MSFTLAYAAHRTDLLLVGLIVGTAVHEMCHAATAWCLGLQVRLILIGHGPVLLHMKLADAWLRVKCMPIGGITKYLPTPGMGRPVKAAIVAAGPLGNVVLLVMLAVAMAVWPRMGPAIGTVALAQIVLIAITLLPFWVRDQPTDGRQLLDLLRPLPEWERPLHAAYLAVFAPGAGTQPPPTPEFAEMFYQEHRPDRYVEAWARKDAWDSMRRILQRNRLSSAERAMVLWFLVMDELRGGDHYVGRAQLDAWSREALELSPAPAVRVARGAVLVTSQRVIEGRGLLLQALSEPLDRGIAADAHGFLAIAEALLGDMAAAEAWMEQAKAGPVGTGSAHNVRYLEQHLAMIRRKALSKSWD